MAFNRGDALTPSEAVQAFLYSLDAKDKVLSARVDVAFFNILQPDALGLDTFFDHLNTSFDIRSAAIYFMAHIFTFYTYPGFFCGHMYADSTGILYYIRGL